MEKTVTELEMVKTQTEITKMVAETQKLVAETAKVRTDRIWVPVATTAGLVVAVMTILDRLLT